MRDAFLAGLTKFAARDPNVYLLTGDTGFTVFEEFQTRFPKQYLNAGIAESAMIGVAAGLALEGKTVFVYGIAPFVTMRCFEQIRVDLCMQHLPVKIVGIGQGLTYGGEGATHHAIEDIAIMASLPNMTVACPGDPLETAQIMEQSLAIAGPLYLRLGKRGEPTLHDVAIEIGKGAIVEQGREIALFSTGNMLATTLEASRLLRAKGLTPAVVSMHTVKPLDRSLLIALAQTCRVFATIEEHGLRGGLGDAVSATVRDEGLAVAVRAFGIADRYLQIGGDQAYLRAQYGLTAEAIVARLQREMPGIAP